MKVLAIIQARAGSTRLPGKIFKDVEGHPLLWHVIERVKKSKLIDSIVVATTQNPEDERTLKIAKNSGVAGFSGSENDVLDRYYQSAKKFNGDVIVRITADCPIIDPQVTDMVIEKFLKNKPDYASNAHPSTYPDGLDVEVFTFNALERSWKEAKKISEREHVTPYMRKGLHHFKIENVKNDANLSAMRWCVDNAEDLEFVRAVYSKLFNKGKTFHMQDVVAMLDKNPDIAKINSHIKRNMGYIKSIRGDVMDRNLSKSREYLKKAENLIPCQTQTLSKGPNQFVQGVSPIFLERGQGSHVWDVDGNEYIDYILALGPVTLGYNYSAINKAIIKQLEKGISFSLPHPLEVELAEILTKIIPCAEMVRFAKNGSDATTGAVRIARAYTERDNIAYCGYHGAQDWYVAGTERNRGIPAIMKNLIHKFEYNKLETLEKIFNENRGKIAAVIMEPVGVEEPKNNFLKDVQKLTGDNGALLIFDEIKTGFRVALGGAQEYYKITPDLGCFGKGIANGMPLSTVVGRRDIMKTCEDVFFSTTFGGECLSLAAAVATIKEIQEKKAIDHIWKIGEAIKNSYNKLAKQEGVNTECVGLPPYTALKFKDSNGKESLNLKSLFLQETIKRKVLSLGIHIISFSHTEDDVKTTLDAVESAFSLMKTAADDGNIKKYLEGKPIQPVFRRA